MTANPFFVSAAAPVASAGSIDPALLRQLVVTADQGGLDFLVIEQPGDAVVAASWLIPATRRIGLVSTLSATYSQPFHVARSLSAMDILSGGRMGWLPSALRHREQSAYFGNLPVLPLVDALDKAVEFVEAAEALWDSWDHDALIIDKASARYLDNGKIRRIGYRGKYFQVMGALNAARPLQGYPVLVLDDADPLFDRLCDRADVLLITAATPAEAEQRLATLKGDKIQRSLVKIACEGPIADRIADWRASGMCDGCHVVPGAPNATEAVWPQLLPELRQRGLLAEHDTSGLLRTRLGLPLPLNPHSGTATNGDA